MRRTITTLIGVSLMGFCFAAAWAQRPPLQEAPMPPLQRQWQQEGSLPVPQAPFASNNPAQTVPSQAVPGPTIQGQGPSAAPSATADRPNTWVPARIVKLQALDKVNAQGNELTIKVGQSASFGSLTITVKSCMVRPPDQPADAAAYLDVTDSHPDSPGFDGWMLQDEPSISMMQHPIYDLRVTGCT